MTLLADKITNGTDNLTATRSAAKVITLTSTVDGKDWSSNGLKERADGSGATKLSPADSALGQVLISAWLRWTLTKQTLGHSPKSLIIQSLT